MERSDFAFWIIKTAPPKGRAVDKIGIPGYSIDTKGAASRTAPQMDQKEVIASVRGRRLLLFVIIVSLDNQGNDSGNDHAELKESFPCNHNHPPSL